MRLRHLMCLSLINMLMLMWIMLLWCLRKTYVKLLWIRRKGRRLVQGLLVGLRINQLNQQNQVLKCHRESFFTSTLRIKPLLLLLSKGMRSQAYLFQLIIQIQDSRSTLMFLQLLLLVSCQRLLF
ncbi:uncharacterized protein LOC111301517 [Durio zibethinus]|uniref:Uncharacterized protein LOC111301517 n=1 Tax=Durio zibethinus TaxID=66656 RepID=A0A6P5ZJC1_DURZI|nr:uncharacterized protein LOC111301517 [Durio zibethinus]